MPDWEMGKKRCGCRSTFLPVILRPSICGALSISANFSFAYANVFLVGLLVGWASVRVSRQGFWGVVRIVLGAMSVAAAVLLVIAGPMLLRFPKQELCGSDH